MDTLYVVQWIGSILGMIGATVLIFRPQKVKFWGFIIFLGSNIVTSMWAMLTGNDGVALSQSFYVLTCLISVYTHRPATNPSQP